MNTQSLTVYSILFTLPEVDPAKNPYIWTTVLWLTMLKRNAGLIQGDRVVLFVDSESFEILQTFDILGYILDSSPFSIEFRMIPRPDTLLDGFLHKYRLEALGEFQQAVYMDIDVLCIRPVRNLIMDSLASADILAMREGNASAVCYLGELSPIESIPSDLPGLSAGWFAVRNTPRVISMVQALLQRCIHGPRLLQHEQPYWNEAVWKVQAEAPIEFVPYSSYETNLASITDTTLLLNLCGEVGNGAFHFERVLTAFIYLTDRA